MKLKNTVSSASFFFVLLYVFVVHCSNENSKKAIWKTSETNTARASRLFVHFIVCLRARIFIILRFTQVNKGQRFYSSFPKLRYILFEFISRKIRQRLTNLLRWNWSDEVWNSSNSLFDLRPGTFAYQQQYSYPVMAFNYDFYIQNSRNKSTNGEINR